MNPDMAKWVVLGVLAAVGVWAARRGAQEASAAPTGSPFYMTNDVRFWRSELAGKLAAELSRWDLAPHPSGTQRVYALVPKGKGIKDALQSVRDLQAAGNVVTSTTNLLDPAGADKSLASILPAEVPTLAKNKDGVAVLPKV